VDLFLDPLQCLPNAIAPYQYDFSDRACTQNYMKNKDCLWDDQRDYVRGNLSRTDEIPEYKVD
jgi:hypothetical protein